jgi:hypothetical protein
MAHRGRTQGKFYLNDDPSGISSGYPLPPPARHNIRSGALPAPSPLGGPRARPLRREGNPLLTVGFSLPFFRLLLSPFFEQNPAIMQADALCFLDQPD